MTTTIIYVCGHSSTVESDKPLTKEQPQNIFGYGGDIKAGGLA